MSPINLQVQGMTCGACVRHVSQAHTIAGVNAVDVDLQSGRVRVEGDPDHATLVTALNDAGYPAQLIGDAPPAAAQKTGCGSGCGCR